MREMAEKFELVERLKEAKDKFFQVSAEFAWGEVSYLFNTLLRRKLDTSF